MKLTEVEVSSRSRNLSFGWRFIRNLEDYDAPAPPTPNKQGGIKTAQAQINEWLKARASGYTARAFFVGGKRVHSVWMYLESESEEEKEGYTWDSFAQRYIKGYYGWGIPCHIYKEIMDRITQGEAVDVLVVEEE